MLSRAFNGLQHVVSVPLAYFVADANKKCQLQSGIIADVNQTKYLTYLVIFMPKRSNDFQKLVKFIYEKISPLGGSVIESGMVLDTDAKLEREVDILIECTVAGHKIKIAIECRDRGRKDSVEWIDGVIGKTKSLAVNKVVAVSNSGFSKAAENKARANNIDIVTFLDANDIDWSRYFIKPGLAMVSGESFELKKFGFYCDNKLIDLPELGLDAMVYHKGEEVGTLEEFVESFFRKQYIQWAEKYILEHRWEIFKTLNDSEKILYLERDLAIPEIEIKNRSAILLTSKIRVLTHSSRRVNALSLSYYEFQNKLVSKASFESEKSLETKIIMLIDPDSEKIHLRIDSADKV